MKKIDGEGEIMELKGIVPALVTPFDRDGNVNYEELKKLVRLLLEERTVFMSLEVPENAFC